MRKRNALIGLAVIVVAGGWYAFRPERLFVNQTVNESLGAVTTSWRHDASSRRSAHDARQGQLPQQRPRHAWHGDA